MAARAVHVQACATHLVRTICTLFLAAPAVAAQDTSIRDIVGVGIVGGGIVGGGKSVLLATPGIEDRGRQWRFRSLDTSAVPQGVHDVALASAGTKLFLETGLEVAVLDLTREYQHNVALQYVDPRDISASSGVPAATHRLPSQRFASIRDGRVWIVDDRGVVLSEFAVEGARLAGVTGDGAVLYVREDGVAGVCERQSTDQSACHGIPGQVFEDVVAVMAGPGGSDPESSRFLLLTGRAETTRIVDPEHPRVSSPPLRRAEAALRASLILHRIDVSNEFVAKAVDALLTEARTTVAGAGETVADWRFFRVRPDEELYAPVLQFGRRESAFPDTFETLEMLGGATATGEPHRVAETLRGKYLRLTQQERRERCTI